MFFGNVLRVALPKIICHSLIGFQWTLQDRTAKVLAWETQGFELGPTDSFEIIRAAYLVRQG